MALNAYTAGLTAAQLMEQCEALANYPGLNLVGGVVSTSSQAFRALNEILTGLYTQYEWPFLDTGGTVAIAARENSLPPDFWRCRFENPLILLDGDSRYVLQQLDPETFFHAGVSAPSQTGRPSVFTIDKNRSSFYVDKTPDQSYVGELHYQKYIARLSATSAVPMFPHPDLLVQKLLAWYYQQQDDTRWQAAKAEADAMFLRIRASAYEDRDSSAAIPLDGRMFRGMPSDPDGYGWG